MCWLVGTDSFGGWAGAEEGPARGHVERGALPVPFGTFTNDENHLGEKTTLENWVPPPPPPGGGLQPKRSQSL